MSEKELTMSKMHNLAHPGSPARLAAVELPADDVALDGVLTTGGPQSTIGIAPKNLHNAYIDEISAQMKKAHIAVSLGITGAAGRNRTGDLRITNALLYQLSYSGGAILQDSAGSAF